MESKKVRGKGRHLWREWESSEGNRNIQARWRPWRVARALYLVQVRWGEVRWDELRWSEISWGGMGRQVSDDTGPWGRFKNFLHTVSGNVNWCSHCEKHYGCFPQKIKNGTIIWSSNLASVCRSKKNEVTVSKRYLHPTFSVALFTIAKIWKPPKCPLVNG